MPEAVFFPSPARLRSWFEKHHATAGELWVGYFKKGSGKPSVTWPESVDEALCVGWIDGIRKSVDERSYTIRFTPRRPRSIWSTVNVQRARALAGEGGMRPAGRKAFQARKENRSGIYSYEQRRERLEEPYEKMLKKNADAWAFFQAQRLVGGQRPEGRDAAQAAGQADRAFGARAPHPAVHARSAEGGLAARERSGLR